jgi:GNAT superfamily N-acetyltransferase
VPDLPLATAYAVRAATFDDAEAVHALIVASDIEEFGEPTGLSLTELRDEWRDLDLARNTWVVHATDGEIVGYASLVTRTPVRMITGGYVHPGHFGRGIGTTLVRLAEARAREHVKLAPEGSRVVVISGINAANQDAMALLTREGYAAERYFLRMEAELDIPPPTPDWPDGITVRAMAPGEDGKVYYETIEEAMQDHYGHVPVSFEQWKQGRMGEAFDPSLWFLAMDGDEPAGAALCIATEDEGWVDTLAVRRRWRKRGLGLALLRHAAGEFKRRGMSKYALAVDSESLTGATRLYERAGMRPVHTYAGWLKELRPGAGLTEHTA